MNKFLSAVVAFSVAVMPVAAQAHDRHDRRDRGSLSTGEAIALGVGVAVLGSIISDRSRRVDRRDRLPDDVDPFRRIDPYNINRPRCIREQVVWRDALGRLYRSFEYRCNR